LILKERLGVSGFQFQPLLTKSRVINCFVSISAIVVADVDPTKEVRQYV